MRSIDKGITREITKKKSNYVCPKCGSDKWRFPNSLKPTESRINVFYDVSDMYECTECNYVGNFFVVDDVKHAKEKIKSESATFLQEVPKQNFIGTIIVLFGIVFLLMGYVLGLNLGLIVAGAAVILYTAKAMGKKK